MKDPKTLSLTPFILLLTITLLSACAGSSTPEPIVTTPVVLPTFTPTATPMPPEPTVTATPATESNIMTNAVVSITAPITNEVSLSDVVTRGGEGTCLIESHIDFAGFPDLETQMGCAIEDASLAAVAINEFGDGPDYNRFMLWLENEQMIYTMLPNATWQAFPDSWHEELPEIQCNPFALAELTSPPIPRRGFGKVWCEVEELQELLGTIEREERLCQHAVTQQFEEGKLVGCFEDATIRYFRVLDDGSWEQRFVQ